MIRELHVQQVIRQHNCHHRPVCVTTRRRARVLLGEWMIRVWLIWVKLIRVRKSLCSGYDGVALGYSFCLIKFLFSLLILLPLSRQLFFFMLYKLFKLFPPHSRDD